MKILTTLFCSACAAVLIPLAALAGSGNRTGTNGASELLIPVGARDIAMGLIGDEGMARQFDWLYGPRP